MDGINDKVNKYDIPNDRYNGNVTYQIPSAFRYQESLNI